MKEGAGGCRRVNPVAEVWGAGGLKGWRASGLAVGLDESWWQSGRSQIDAARISGVRAGGLDSWGG